MNYSAEKKSLISKIKDQDNWYKMNWEQGVLVNPNEIWLNNSLTTDFFAFSKLSIPQLKKIIKDNLTKITDTEVYQITEEEKGKNIIQWIVNYENEDCFAYYSFWLAQYEYRRKKENRF